MLLPNNFDNRENWNPKEDLWDFYVKHKGMRYLQKMNFTVFLQFTSKYAL